jgi:hypothetical protein
VKLQCVLRSPAVRRLCLPTPRVRGVFDIVKPMTLSRSWA